MKRGTLALSWGPSGGFYLHPRRVCLGRLAITLIPDVEVEDMMRAYVDEHERTRDDLKVDRATHALSRFVFPGALVPRSEMARAVIDAVFYPDGYEERLPARTIVRIPTETPTED
ncbi:hypothetical protein LRS13_14575 [Svornostia abyssi]|uniref:Uncharacterized protein n=1 Tax=Svornostia abyssi TaxID=2898438 RepID=A0ABY5PBF2_9ACTN|nr:hypothetical protein LRS13_14575 [Parviterribacteraceae bacterium J379]